MRDHPGLGLARVADIDELELGNIGDPLPQRIGGQPRGHFHVALVLEHHRVGFFEIADHPVETDSGEAILTLQLPLRVGHENQVHVGLDHRPGELGVTAL